MTTTTRRFAQLLRNVQAWDSRHQAMCHAQRKYLLDNFCFGNQLCIYANPLDRQKWNIPKIAGKHLFTRCGS